MLNSLFAIPPAFFSADGKKLSRLAYLFLFMLCFASFSPGLVTMPPTDRDESSFAQASKQMIETGNYTDIRLQEAPRYKKPVGIYWMQAAAVKLLSPRHLDDIWAYRVPSLLGATIAVLMTAALGSLLFSPAAGLIAAMMLASCMLLNVEARLAKTDAVLLATVVTAQYALARAYLRQAQGWAVPLLFWGALAVGILVKGPLVLLPILSVLAVLRYTDKSIGWFRDLKPWRGLLLLLLLVSPWFITILVQSHGQFAQQAAVQDMISKLWQGQNRGIVPPGMHFLALPLMFFPFSLFVFMALPDMWRNRRDVAVKFCLAWIVPTWIVFELSLTKLPHYVLPVYPALALLAAKFLLDGLPSMSAAKRRFPIAAVLSLWFIIGYGLAFMAAIAPATLGGEWRLVQILASVGLCVLTGVAILLLPRDKSASAVCLTLASLIFCNALFGDTVPHLRQVWLSRDIVTAVNAAAPCPQSRLISVGYGEPSLVFLAGTQTRLLRNGEEAAEALKADSCGVVLIDFKRKQDFLNAMGATPPVEIRGFIGINTGHGSETALTLYKQNPTASSQTLP